MRCNFGVQFVSYYILCVVFLYSYAFCFVFPSPPDLLNCTSHHLYSVTHSCLLLSCPHCCCCCVTSIDVMILLHAVLFVDHEYRSCTHNHHPLYTLHCCLHSASWQCVRPIADGSMGSDLYWEATGRRRSSGRY